MPMNHFIIVKEYLACCRILKQTCKPKTQIKTQSAQGHQSAMIGEDRGLQLAAIHSMLSCGSKSFIHANLTF